MARHFRDVFRFSLRWLLSFIAFVAVGLVSLTNASYLISGCLLAAWILSLSVAVLGAIYRTERHRAFWIGCCVFGWSFAAGGTFSGVKTSEFDQAIQSLYDAISWTNKVETSAAEAHIKGGGDAFSAPGGGFIITLPRRAPFKLIASTLISFVIAYLGGVVAQWFYATRDQKTK